MLLSRQDLEKFIGSISCMVAVVMSWRLRMQNDSWFRFGVPFIGYESDVYHYFEQHSIPNYLLNDQLVVFSTKTVFAQKHALSHSIKSDLYPTFCFNTLLLNDANLRAFFLSLLPYGTLIERYYCNHVTTIGVHVGYQKHSQANMLINQNILIKQKYKLKVLFWITEKYTLMYLKTYVFSTYLAVSVLICAYTCASNFCFYLPVSLVWQHR